MVTIVPSRFAGLKIEDDEDEFRKPKQKSKPTAGAKPKTSSVKNVPSQQAAQTTQKKPKPKPQKSKTSNEAEQKEQWSKWQEKDSELVEKSYMTDLEQALLLSKLDFEANKTKYTQSEKDTKPSTGKAKKPKTLSLQEFQEQISKDALEKEHQRQQKLAEDEYNRSHSFFEQIDLETKQIVSKEQIKSLFQTRDVSSFSTKDATETGKKIKPTQSASAYSEVEQLKAENLCLKEEMATLRDRYKKVVGMLKSGEMKEKTELLVEIEKLKKTQEDMTAEMTALYGELEQAKSKSNQDGKGKEKTTARRSVRIDASTEKPPANQ